ncbi:MAG: S41 family peptidase [Bacteriovoracaceae bacterium]|jgi:carboxyl-terminal processing protease|nr:S41 family peptidase [Bacteriovoracaceae bacterium]
MRLILFVLLCTFTLPVIADVKKDSRFKDLELFNKILFLIENQYYRPVDRRKLIEGALKGMMNTLDPHSSFLDEEFYNKMEADTQGEFGGLGIEVTQKEGVLYIVTPIEDSPAYKAGLLSGDKIIEIDHESIVGMTLDEAMDKMKGKNGTKVTLGIKRNGSKKIKSFTITRSKIKVNPVKSQIVNDQYAWIRLTQFQNKASQYVENALKKIKKKTALKGIILDLRSNPGGRLQEAINLSSLFLKSGIVVSTKARDPKNETIHYVKKSGYKDLSTPIAVLINASSASASEIVAGALQDHKRALIMGTRSFGKGSVQNLAKVDSKRGVKLTIAQYLTPNNNRVQAIGIKPDIEILNLPQQWVEENKNSKAAIREKDLRNHLTSTIETKEEKELRLILQKERKKRRSSIPQKKKKLPFKKYSAKDDYQVLQAINFLSTATVLKK